MTNQKTLLSTTYHELDETLGGLRSGSITSFGCYDINRGKSLIYELIIRSAFIGTNILYLSAEDSQRHFELELISTLANLTPYKVISYMNGLEAENDANKNKQCLTEEEQAAFLEAQTILRDLPVSFQDSLHMSLEDIRACAKNMRDTIEPDKDMLIIIDQAFSSLIDHSCFNFRRLHEGMRKERLYWDTKSSYADYSFGLRAISQETDAPIVTIEHNTRRSRYHVFPITEDFDFYDIECAIGTFFVDQDCDVLIALDEISSDETTEECCMNMHILKNSYGGLGSLSLRLSSSCLEPALIGRPAPGHMFAD